MVKEMDKDLNELALLIYDIEFKKLDEKKRIYIEKFYKEVICS